MNSNDKKPLVVCQCATYNHEPYIRECLEGFVMQKTDFPFIAVVIDDCSTDATADIVREYEQKYPDIIKAVYLKENYYSQGKKKDSIWHSFNKDAKYIAICEGDDYWTDPLKLQKQVDFLEEHEDFVLCATRFKRYYQDTGVWKDDFAKEAFGDITDGIAFDNRMNFKFWFTQTLTALFRKTAFDTEVLKQYHRMFDVHIFYHILKKGKGYCFNSIDAVYRKHGGGIFSGLDAYNRQKMVYSIHHEILEKNSDDIDVIENFGLCSKTYLDAIR